jgi:hypothetical protein
MGTRTVSGEHKLFSNALQCDDSLKLRDFISRINMIDTFALILIALMYGINANVARFIIGRGFSAQAYRRFFRACFSQCAALTLVGF